MLVLTFAPCTLTFAPCACGGSDWQQLTVLEFLPQPHKDSSCTHGGFTHCNLHQWCFFFHPQAQILDLHSGNLHCVVVTYVYILYYTRKACSSVSFAPFSSGCGQEGLTLFLLIQCPLPNCAAQWSRNECVLCPHNLIHLARWGML